MVKKVTYSDVYRNRNSISHETKMGSTNHIDFSQLKYLLQLTCHFQKAHGKNSCKELQGPLGWAHSMYSGWESVVIWRLTLQSANTVRLTVWHHAKVSNEKWTACETVTVLSFNYLIVMQYYSRYLEIVHLSDSVSRSVIGKQKYMS